MHPENQLAPRNAAATADVLEHLAESLDAQWRRYRKRLKQCQARFSAEAVHDSRVETRRLLATIELLAAFLPRADVKKARRALKRHLDTFGPLRDAQVQFDYVGRMMGAFSAARAFRDWLQQREAHFARETRQAIRSIKTKRLGRRIAAFEEAVRRRRKGTARTEALDAVRREIAQAFARVARLCQRVRAENTVTIHRTRVAFKRFRYLVEALSPA